MIIDYTKFEMSHWYEDIDGNIIDRDKAMELDRCTYHSCFPLEITEHIYSYSWQPSSRFEKIICRIKPIRRYLMKKNKNNKTYNLICDCNTNIGSGNEEAIIAMVNSGDFTLSQALWVWANSCERCMNVLAYKYLDGKDGYPEFSEEWQKVNTECSFCKGK